MEPVANRLRLRSPRARSHAQWLSRFQIFDHGAEVNGLRIKPFVFGDLRAVQDFETITLEHFFAAPAFEGHDLSVNAFFAATIEITQICTHERTRSRHLARVREQVDMKMRNAPRRGRHFPPTVHQCPTNKSPRGLVVPEIAGERFEKERNVLPERIELVEQRVSRTEQVATDITVDLNHEGRLWFMIGVIGREKIGEQLSIFINGSAGRSAK